MKYHDVQVGHTHYFKDNYDSKTRFCSYWHQIDEIIKCKPRSVLEVGVGNGFVSDYLKKRGVKVTTCDIDRDLNPDVIGSVLELPFKDRQFEVVACYEVLEHIPYEDVGKAISEMVRVSNRKVIISTPDKKRVYKYLIQIPKIGEKYIHLPVPVFKKHNHQFGGEHYWEIGKKGYSLEDFKSLIIKNGLTIDDSFRVFENPSHRFFICSKNQEQ